MESSAKRSYLEDWSDWELISVPMLDTDFDRSDKETIRAILSRRGITGRKLMNMRLFAYIGLLYNGLRGEWVILDLQDIIHGWSLNAFVTVFLFTVIPICRLGSQQSSLFGYVAGAATGVVMGVVAFRLVRRWLRTKLGNGA